MSFMNNELLPILTDMGVSEVDIEKAKSYQQKHGGRLELLLVNLGSLSDDQLPLLYSKLLQVPLLSEVPEVKDDFEQSLTNELNKEFLKNRNWIAFGVQGSDIQFLTSDPLNREVTQYFSMLGLDYSVSISSQGVVEELASLINHDETEIDEDSPVLTVLEEDKLRELASEAPTVNFLNGLIAKGLKLGASDMHIEPVKGRFRVRYRIDGVLKDTDSVPVNLQLPIISRIKILSDMDIAEKRRPQDGKIETRIANTELDIRVSALPLNEGESIVMRFLKKTSVTYDISTVGIAPDIESKLLQDIKSTAGVVLLTGPTGSGKTTTLYTFLNALNNDNVKIITLEDPVEYQLNGINQVQVNSDIGFTFGAGLRSIVRQDPDIIMLGEIRDKETAQIALQSALTGHLVFSTVHTNDAPSAFTRLLDLGVEEFLLNAAIVSIVAQRLARKLCSHCSEVDDDQEALISQYELRKRFPDCDIELRKPVGCEHCSHTGYKGRTAVIEYLRCTEDIKQLDKGEDFILAARKVNKINGNRTLIEDGLYKAISGITTIDEVLRVAG